ncbi:beta strand repeat-containing protein, partial [Paraburkholderia sp. J11-2]|uniref:beta strand repeat-containing protein n=1 Tax=Paraburkholderia sp. J11-2 TaxID=2805431 RepID=UPI0039EEBA13
MAFGFGSNAAGGATALGTQSFALGNNSVAIGLLSTATLANSVALGNGAKATVAATPIPGGMIGGTSYSYAGTAPIGVVSVGAAGAERQIQNVAAGNLTASSTDAVNGSELYATNTQVTTNANNITTLQGQVTTIQGQVTTLQGNVTTINGQITNLQGKLADAVMYDSSSHTSVTLGGSGSTTPVALHNVQNGTLSATSTDAVNGSQLNATNTNVTNLSNTVNNINNGGGIKYFHTNSSLADSSAVATNSTAIGPAATATSGGGVAIGLNTLASGGGVVSLGSGSTASGSNGSVAIGSSTTASGTGAIAMGVGGSFGGVAVASGMDAMALGNGATASAQAGTALGVSATASGGTYATAVGANAVATGNNSAAMGYNAKASGQNGVAIGYGANASVANSVALGSGATTSAAVGTASGVIGGTTYNYAGTSPTGTVSVGSAGAERTVTNVAAGQVAATSTDAVNGSQLYAADTQITANANNITTLQGNVTTLQGNVTTINGQITTIDGQITNMQGQLADAVLYDSSAHTSVTLGGSGSTTPVALHNVQNGTLSATSTDAVNGSQLNATNTNVSNLAGNVTTLQGNVTTINGQITNMQGQLADAVLYDSSAHTSVTLGGSGSTTPVALHNVANGTLGASSLDAVNGSQLYATNTNVSNLAGNVTNLAGDVTTINGQITNMQGQLADAVLYDSSAHDSVTLGGTGATSAVALHNVANGTLSASSLDAVNGSQLYATNTNVSNLSGEVTTLQGNVTSINGQITNIDGQITNMQGQLADAVLYDSSAHDSVTLGGTGATSAVALHNVANGALGASSLDAVNGSQLYATNQSISNLSGDITNINGQLADAVLYDSSAHDSVTLGGSGATSAVALHNVANGTLSASSLDAVNGSQLYATNTNVSNLSGAVTTLQGNVTTINGQITNMQGQLADAVLYDSSAHDSVTLGGTGATSAVALHNVANGALGASSLDAVNGSQLYATNQSISNLSGDITNINGQLADAVLYDSSAHDSVTLGGTGATSAVALHNVANGTLSASSLDAVNGSQLYATNTNVSNLAGNVTNLAGDVTTIDGQITNMQGQLADAVLYDSSAHDSVTLGGTSATSAVALHNVANGMVNASSLDAVNGSQLYSVSSSTAAALGGGSTVNSDGSISAPTYLVGGDTY